VWGADRPVVTEIHLCLTPVLVKKYKEQTDAHHFCCRRPPAPAKQAVQRRAVDLAQAPPIHAGEGAYMLGHLQALPHPHRHKVLPASAALSILRDKNRRRVGTSQSKQHAAGRSGRRTAVQSSIGRCSTCAHTRRPRRQRR
jgi:hypothetical protein